MRVSSTRVPQNTADLGNSECRRFQLRSVIFTVPHTPLSGVSRAILMTVVRRARGGGVRARVLLADGVCAAAGVGHLNCLSCSLQQYSRLAFDAEHASVPARAARPSVTALICFAASSRAAAAAAAARGGALCGRG